MGTFSNLLVLFQGALTPGRQRDEEERKNRQKVEKPRYYWQKIWNVPCAYTMQKNSGAFASADGVTATGVFRARGYSFMDAVFKGPRSEH